MEAAVTIRRVGDSLAVILPPSMVDSLGLKEGDELRATATGDGIQLLPQDADFASMMDDAREFMRTHAGVFQALAK